LSSFFKVNPKLSDHIVAISIFSDHRDGKIGNAASSSRTYGQPYTALPYILYSQLVRDYTTADLFCADHFRIVG